MKDKTLNKDKDKLLTMGSFYGWPMGLWFMIFFVAPLIIIFVYSFLKKGTYGGVEWKLSFKAYKQMCKPDYGLIVLRTLKITILSTIFTILVSNPQTGKEIMIAAKTVVKFKASADLVK